MPGEGNDAESAEVPGTPGPPGLKFIPAAWTRLDTAVAVLLGFANILAHLPFRARHLSTWDSVLFALGMERYSVPEARPHPPGYPVYIALARLARPAFADENATLVFLSLVMAAGAVVACYALGRRLMPRGAAFAAAALFGLSPVLAHNAVMATSYAGEALFAIAVAWASWSARRAPGPRSAAVLGAVFLLALGFRQSLLFYLTPLVAWALLAWPRNLRVLARRATAFVAASVAVGLAWLIPLLWTSGGVRPYSEATALQARLVVFADTVFTDGRTAWDDHWTRFLLYVRPETLYLLPILAVLALAALAAWPRLRSRGVAVPAPAFAREGMTFLAFWIVPALLFYLLIFDGWDKGPDGYALVLLPPLYLAFAAAGNTCIDAVRAAVPARIARAAAVLPILLLLPAPGLVAGWEEPLREVSDHDAWTESWQGLEREFLANDTAIVASYSWAHAKWFFPDYILWSRLAIPPGPDWDEPWVLTMQTRHREEDVSFYEAHLRGPVPTQHAVPDDIRRVVLLDFQLAGENGGDRTLRPEVEVKEAFLAGGWRILYFDTDDAHPTIESYFVDG